MLNGTKKYWIYFSVLAFVLIIAFNFLTYTSNTLQNSNISTYRKGSINESFAFPDYRYYFGEFDVSPHKSTKESCIVYLAPYSDQIFQIPFDAGELKRIYRIELLAASIHSLKIAFGPKFDYPVVIFHQNYKEKEKNFLLETYPNIIFQEFEYREPQRCNVRKQEEYKKVRPFLRDYGYNSMCRYWSTLIFLHPVLSRFKNVMRMDDDSFFFGKLSFDVFDAMKDYVYVYTTIATDLQIGLRNYSMLFPFFINNQIFDVLNEKDIYRKATPHGWATPDGFNGRYPNTNFLITRLDFWRTKEAVEFSRKYGCQFLEYSWTDSTIHALWVSLLFKATDVWAIRMPYGHNFHDPSGVFYANYPHWKTHLRNNTIYRKRYKP